MLQNDTVTIWPRRQDRTRCESIMIAEATRRTEVLEDDLPRDQPRERRRGHDRDTGRTGYASRDLPGVRGSSGLISL